MMKVVLAALVLLTLVIQPAPAMAADEVTVWRLVYPPDGQAGPPNLWCFTYRKLSPVGIAPPINPGPPVVGATGAGEHWMTPLPSPLAAPYDQGNIQVDNPTAHPITAWAIGVPAGSVDSPILGLVQAEYGGGLPNGWQSATVTRHQWDNNVWTAPNVNDPAGGPAGEWEPAPGPGDWSPRSTNDDGVRFDDLFGKGEFDTAILFWTVDLDHAIAPGTTMNGFLLGSIGHGLSGRSLPFADFGVDGLLGTGNLTLVPEPTALSLFGLGALGLLVRRGRRGN